jgi:capsular polysaccharide biosynthesis protein
VILWKTPSVLEVESAFFLFSTWNNQWAHFLSELYPRLAFLDRLPTDRPICLPVLENLDPHILALIESRTAQYPQVQLLPIDARTAVRARTLYHVELGTFLGNAGTFQSPFSIQISDSTNAFWKQTLSPAEGSSPAPRSGKLFIGRSGGRSLKNYEAVRSFFVAQGFEEVFPHRLSYAEKVALFRNATHVAGPLSSGFTNVVYCYPQISVLVLANVQRDADTLFTGFCKLMGHKLWFMTGIDSDLRDVNSDYTIDMNVLQTFFHSTFAPKAQGGSLV